MAARLRARGGLELVVILSHPFEYVQSYGDGFRVLAACGEASRGLSACAPTSPPIQIASRPAGWPLRPASR
jgi:hypothetical protein